MRHVSDAASHTSIVVRAETTLAGFARMSVGSSMTPLGRSRSIRSKHTKWRVIAGNDSGYLVTTSMTRVSAREREDGISRGGWRIDCAGCGKRFESFGLRYCKPECARVGRERLEARALMAEVGMSIDRRRPCQRCGKPIPRWRNGRAVRKNAKFCGRC
jgi:hypothetical protein